MLRVRHKSTQVLLPSSSARPKPRDSTRESSSSQPEQPSTPLQTSHRVRGILQSTLLSYSKTIRFKTLNAVSLSRVVCKQLRSVIFPRKYLLDTSFISNQIQTLCLQLQRHNTSSIKLCTRFMQLTRDYVPVSHHSQWMLV